LFRGYFIGAPGRDLGARSENEADDSIIIQQAVREAATICPAPASWPFDLESGVRVTCDCANVSLPMPLCSRLRPDVRDRQTDVRSASSLTAPTLGARA